jgi:hypothetical protein
MYSSFVPYMVAYFTIFCQFWFNTLAPFQKEFGITPGSDGPGRDDEEDSGKSLAARELKISKRKRNY